MKKRIFGVFLATFLGVHGVAQAQLSLKEGVSLEEITRHLNELYQQGDDESIIAIRKEAKLLEKSTDEEFVATGVNLYRVLGDSTAFDTGMKRLYKRFPKGLRARHKAFYEAIGNASKPVLDVERDYWAWTKAFPSSWYPKDKDQVIYGQGFINLAIRFGIAHNSEMMYNYLRKLNSKHYFEAGVVVSRSLVEAKEYKTALPLLEELYALSSKKPEVDLRDYYLTLLVRLYSETLINQFQNEKALTVLEEYLAERGDKELVSIPSLTVNYVKALDLSGQSLNAFLIAEAYMKQQGVDELLITLQRDLYLKLNQNKSTWEDYQKKMDAASEEKLLAKIKSEMVKQEAPDFSLPDLEGNTVKLSDLRGKVVVLDFWATWCNPCIASFPGMQASVDKYKGDPNVVFLFIDTWERGGNYKDNVLKFLKKNDYRFHVLFDEMEDQEKSVVGAYGAKGIPYKVVIDKEGFIRFITTGGSSDVNKTVEDITRKINLASDNS